MDLKSFDDPQPVAPTDTARAKVRVQGNRIRLRRRLALSAPVVFIVAAAIAIPIAVATSNNRSDIQRIQPITPPTPSATTTGPSISPTNTPPSPNPAVTATLGAGAPGLADPAVIFNAYTTADGTTIYPHGGQGGFANNTKASMFWTVVAGASGFELKVNDFTGTRGGQSVCSPYAEAPEQRDAQLQPGQSVTWELLCDVNPDPAVHEFVVMTYSPGGIPTAVWK